MKYLIILLLAAFPLGQLARLTIPGTEIVLHPNDFIVFAVVVFWFTKNRRLSGPLVRPLLVFTGAVIISLVFNLTRFSPQQLMSSALYPLRFFIYAGLFFVFSSLKQEERNLTSRWLLIAALIVAAFGLAQYIFVPNVAFLSALDWDDHYYRLVGSFLDPGFTGAILALGLVLIFMNFKNFLILFLVYVAMALTYSRASCLLYLVSFATISFYKRSVQIFIFAILVLLITMAILPKTFGEGTKLGRENSITARLNNWQQSLFVWQKKPIFGVGFNTYRYVVAVGPQSHSGGADSSILLVLATTGIVGLLAYLNVLRVVWQLSGRNLLFKASFLGILVHSFFNNTLFYPWVMEWLWIVLALNSERSIIKEK